MITDSPCTLMHGTTAMRTLTGSPGSESGSAAAQDHKRRVANRTRAEASSRTGTLRVQLPRVGSRLAPGTRQANAHANSASLVSTAVGCGSQTEKLAAQIILSLTIADARPLLQLKFLMPPWPLRNPRCALDLLRCPLAVLQQCPLCTPKKARATRSSTPTWHACIFLRQTRLHRAAAPKQIGEIQSQLLSRVSRHVL